MLEEVWIESVVMDKKNILIIDDEKCILSSFERLLKETPFHVDTVTNTTDAYKIFKEKTIHLAICDYKLPDEDGLNFLVMVRKYWPNTLRILLTGYPNPKLAQRAVNEAAVFRFITKPWNDAQILDA